MQIQENVSFYQVVQQHIDGYLQHINLTSKDVIAYVSIFGLSFLCGVMLKRYGSHIVSLIIGAILFLAVLSYFDLILINVSNMKALFGMEHIHSLDDGIIELKLRMGHHMVEILVGFGAMMLGFKLG